MFSKYRLFVIIFLISSAPLLAANPKLPNDLKLVGKAKLSFLWWHIYDSELKTLTGDYQKNLAPLLLTLTYKRSITQQELVDETESQWKTFNLPSEKQAVWLQQLSSFWPNVKKNDVIAVFLDANQHTHFFFNDRFIGSLNSPEFGEAFLAIWLDEDKSAYPKLTRKLTGKKK